MARWGGRAASGTGALTLYKPRTRCVPAPSAGDDGGSVNLETLYGAIGDGAITVRIPKHARKELEAYLDCGLRT
jgi:hypothetical protein